MGGCGCPSCLVILPSLVLDLLPSCLVPALPPKKIYQKFMEFLGILKKAYSIDFVGCMRQPLKKGKKTMRTLKKKELLGRGYWTLVDTGGGQWHPNVGYLLIGLGWTSIFCDQSAKFDDLEKEVDMGAKTTLARFWTQWEKVGRSIQPVRQQGTLPDGTSLA